MINKNILILSALCSCCSLWADEVVVRHYNYAGPYEVKKPFLADSLDVNSKRFSDKELLNTTVPFCNLSQSGQPLTRRLPESCPYQPRPLPTRYIWFPST